ncbi:MAG: hypothetical protein MUO21_07685 [Nitrososphaeraceae archaeon]|nr:hypothetical protein [Nitrososphaeraceae archaeon]
MINGPYNLVRLEGKIGNIKKVFYLFMDKHMPPNVQTECPDLRSTHIRNYLIDEFDKLTETNRKVDFFLEAFPDTSTVDWKISDIYLTQVRKMFEKMFNFDFKKNKVIASKEFSNVRLHYIDIRSYFTFNVGDPFSLGYKIGDYIFNLPNDKVTQEAITSIRDGLTIFYSQLKIIHDALFMNLDKVTKTPIIRKDKGKIHYSNDEATNAIKYLVNKMRFIYKNKEVQDKINDIIKTDMFELFDKFEKKSNELDKILDRFPTKADITKIYSEFENIMMNLFCLIVDIYFLRRSLDKDYVTTSITYTGGLHSSNYIKYLIQKFDFKITHKYYSEILNLETLNKKIKSINDPFNILKLFSQKGEKEFYQCIDVSDFTENFQ